ncbi:myrosinase 1-like [Thrips palmi]|uniref:beta-glucosidase n=1 Tax=Thrips palmi TaxID=161013 RepID=A0A6P8Z492_THRPL|nr:myrosinase 1-like [Thrips palmi]
MPTALRAVAVLAAMLSASATALPSGPLSAHIAGPRGLASGTAGSVQHAAKAAEDAVVDAELSIPTDFWMGAGSASYQIEGAWNVDGKGMSTTDHAYGNRSDGGGNEACDSYHHYKEDVALLKLMGATHYRFSIAWARLLPTGEPDNVNPLGVRYYNNLINELLDNGIQPVVTLWHVDLPFSLYEAFGGWNDERIVGYFLSFAVTAFRLFGDRVRTWTTVNEPHMFCRYGAGHSRMGSPPAVPGHSEYLCGHHVLLAHAKAYRAYKRDFASQGGRIGMSLDNYFTRPCTNAYEDVEAAERHQEFEVGWFLEPILGSGDYPPVMRRRVGSRLPTFTAAQKAELQGSLDFIGLNSYYGWTACNGAPSNARNPSFEMDQDLDIPEASDINNPPGDFQWTPWSIRSTLMWVRDRYDPDNTIPFVITENGLGMAEGAEDDNKRKAYFSAWLQQLMHARYHDQVNVIGYFVWSLLDDFEWAAGYTVKIGLVHVDFNSPNRTRTPKESLYFMKDIIASRRVTKYEVPSSSPISFPNIVTLCFMIILSRCLV